MSDDKKKEWQRIKEEAEREIDQQEIEAEENPETEEAASLEHLDYEELEEKLTLAEQKAHENWEQVVSLQAELVNVRRRAERDVENAHRYGVEKLISSLIPVLDSLEQALQLAEKDQNQGMKEGLELTIKLFLDVLEKSEVEQVNPHGATFDPQQHEAMSVVPSADVPANTVLEVFQKGYMLKGRVIRPARVIVSKK